MDDNFKITGLVEQRKDLERLMMSNPQMEKQVQKLIRKVLLAARSVVANDAKGAMRSDPRQAYKAVKSSVYRRILGGSVSLLNKRGDHKTGILYEPPRTLRPGQRGGNRRPVSDRTRQVNSYEGSSRAFILRFISLGTTSRDTRYGNRGSITARHFFDTSSQQALERAADQLGQLIDDLIKKEIK